MALLPTGDMVTIGKDIEIIQPADQTTRTYKLDIGAGRVVGFVDGIEAMKQAITKILLTERFAYLIYSWNYGIELNDLIGKSLPVLSSEIKRVIREALLADSRIRDITDFTVEQVGKRAVHVKFTAETIFGEIPIERTVTANV